jgi:hypothetical protein
MQRRRITFTRLLRMECMRYGVAVDKAGKRWRGFYATRTATEVLYSGDLGDIGLCRVCRSRVYQGWTCLNDARDLCESCVQPPPENKLFVVENLSNDDWERLMKEFFRHADFDYQRRDQGAHRPGS